MVRFTEEPVRLLIIGGLVIAAVLIWYNCCYYSEAQEIVFVKEAASVIESSGEASYSGKININTATKEQLAELEGIGQFSIGGRTDRSQWYRQRKIRQNKKQCNRINIKTRKGSCSFPCFVVRIVK